MCRCLVSPEAQSHTPLSVTIMSDDAAAADAAADV